MAHTNKVSKLVSLAFSLFFPPRLVPSEYDPQTFFSFYSSVLNCACVSQIAKDAKECVQECVSEFISFITSEASERCHQEKRKTINGEDILFAMSTLGFDMYLEPLKLYLQKFREAMKGEKGIPGVSVGEGLGEELTDDSFTNQLPAGIITADGQQQNVMVYTTSYQQIPGVQQIQFS
ncbi:unnamed protein product [Oncorhynchus mykiss]|uniref:Nuclear transcription factor Y subunit beta n=1 Tax=Oncorhynchus mykiss TaxID=8022 RepID=A0A060Y871_ONCMY|nr:unnamed protein product [Oncorhynchus mykiss]